MLPEDLPSEAASPLEMAIKSEAYERYRDALLTLSPRDRELIVQRVELQWPLLQIAEQAEMGTADAARMAVSRALKRLAAAMKVA